MRKYLSNNKHLLKLIIFFAIALRTFKISSTPPGLSLQEVNFGLQISNSVGDWFINPLAVRLAFVVIGIFSIWIFKRLAETFFGEQVGLLATFLLSITPWHIWESRIYSEGLVIFYAVLTILFWARKNVKNNLKTFGKVVIGLGAVALLVSVFVRANNAKYRVDERRNLIAGYETLIPERVFINKYVESYREVIKKFSESLDFGYVFFSGHPRERNGVEEYPKLYIIYLPFLIVGLKKLNENERWFFGGLTFFVVSIPILFDINIQSYYLLFLFPILSTIALGMKESFGNFQSRKILLTFSIVVLIFESSVFFANYLGGYFETLWSPRETIYEDLTGSILTNKKGDERVLINQRIGNPEPFIKFYSKGRTKDLEYADYNVWEESPDQLFVDTYPDGDGPLEPLYTKSGEWPEPLNVIDEFYDSNSRQTVVVYRFK